MSLTIPENCTGCYACVNICPHGCIEMEDNFEGFWYPQINFDTCIDCGLCEKACSLITPLGSAEKVDVYAAFNKNLNERIQSSSGGLFGLMAAKILDDGGVVFGAALQSDMSLAHVCVDRHEDLKPLNGSKYFQSRIGICFFLVRQLLCEGLKVMFSGTPCQVEGLLAFLEKPYPNLLTMDFVCHGVGSPKLWDKYIKDRENKFGKKIVNANFRDKKYGWKAYSLSLTFEDGVESISNHWEDEYMRLYLSDICMRKSCYSCKAKKDLRMSDVTLADFWQISKFNKKIDDDNGMSLVFINSDKGQKALDKISTDIEMFPVDRMSASCSNYSMLNSVKKNSQRDAFFKTMDEKGISDLVEQYTTLSVKTKIKILLIKAGIYRYLKQII